MSLTDILIGVWCESSDPTTDLSGNGETPTNTNTVGTTPGKVGTAGTFAAASSQYLTHADDASLSTGDVDWTLAAWVYHTALTNHTTIAAKREALEFVLEYETGDATYRLFWGQNALSVMSLNFGTPSTGTWYHVVAWHDAASNLIGISVNAGTPNTASDSGASAVDGNGTFNIGRDPIFGNYWDGRLNQVAVWKRVLTSQERTDLYNGGSGLAYSSWGGGGISGTFFNANGPGSITLSGTAETVNVDNGEGTVTVTGGMGTFNADNGIGYFVVA